MKPCPNCPKLTAIAREAIQTILDMLEANRDAAGRAEGPMFGELFRLGLRATAAKLSADIAALEAGL